MLNAVEELKKYRKIDIDDTGGIDTGDSNGTVLIKSISEEIGRLSRGQFRMSQKLEDFSQEIIEAVDSNTGRLDEIAGFVNEKDAVIVQQSMEIKELMTENNKLYTNFTTVLDLFYTIVSFIAGSGDTAWREQAEMAMRNVLAAAAEAGIEQIGGKGVLFDERLHEAVDTVCDEKLGFREVAGLEAKGYLYKGRVIKKAKVIVNNWRGEKENNG